MHKLKRATPSPALVVAIVALSAALVGTATAGPVEIGGTTADGPTADASLNKREKRQTRNIARRIARRLGRLQTNRLITRRAPSLSVQSATSAESAASAAEAEDAENLGGSPPGAYAAASAGLKAAFVYDDGDIENPVGGPFTVDSNGNGVDRITFPFDVNNGDYHLVVTPGGAAAHGGTTGCIVAADAQLTDANTVDFELTAHDGNPCNEEFTVLVF